MSYIYVDNGKIALNKQAIERINMKVIIKRINKKKWWQSQWDDEIELMVNSVENKEELINRVEIDYPNYIISSYYVVFKGISGETYRRKFADHSTMYKFFIDMTF